MLEGEKVRLRALERGDLPTIVRWFNDPEARRRLARVEPMSLAEEERWFEGLLRATTEVAFGIVEAGATGSDADAFVGTCGLHRIDWRNRAAALGILVGERAARGRGLGRDATATLVQHAFANLGLHRIELEVLADNDAAVRCYEGLGFVHEGTRKDARFQGGQFVDLRVMRLLSTEWRPATTSSSSKGQPHKSRQSLKRS